MKKQTTNDILKKIAKDISAMRTGIDLLVSSDTLIKSINEQPTKSVPSDGVTQIIKAKTLIWGKVCEDKLNWKEAKKWCEAQGPGWRLPTQIELLQAYQDNVEGFGVDRYYWSATTYAADTSQAWFVGLSDGSTNYYYKTPYANLRCVRELI